MGPRSAFGLAVLVFLAGGTLQVQAQGDSKAAFLSACAINVKEENPIWSDQQLSGLCTCMYELLDAEFSNAEIAKLTSGMQSGSFFDVPERINTANTMHAQSCVKQLSAPQ